MVYFNTNIEHVDVLLGTSLPVSTFLKFFLMKLLRHLHISQRKPFTSFDIKKQAIRC